MSIMYPHLCTIQLRSQIGTGKLGPVMTWANEQVNVPCKFEMMAADMVLRLYGEGVIRAVTMFLPYTATITENTRQVVTTQAGFAGTWIVKAVKPYTILKHYEVDMIPDMSTTAGQ